MISSAWEVLMLFLIPIGGGIPAGVILARNRGLDWPTMALLYLISDIILALFFEPMLILIRLIFNKSIFLTRFSEAFKIAMNKTIAKYGVNPGPFTLIMVSFGVDPMTGRTAALAAGHRFIAGWTIAIIGDMLFFGVVMASTLWLNDVLGDGTWTVVIITVAIIAIPNIIQRIRRGLRSKPS